MQSLKGGGQIRPQPTMNHPSQEPDKRRLFRIGEVAAMFHVSVGTLRHYEKEGLLVPAYTDLRSGYRYYGAREFETLNTIRYLRCLDMPLEAIAGFLQNRDPAVMEKKLRQQKACLAQKRRALDIMARKIDHRLSALSGARLAPPGEIRLTVAPPCRIVQLQADLQPRTYVDLEWVIRRLEKDQPEPLSFLGKVGVGITAAHLTQGVFDRYDLAFLLLDKEDRYQGTVDRLPQTPCVTLRFRGSHPSAPPYYARLLAYIAAHRMTVNGFSREITLIDNGLSRDESQFVTEISIPVRLPAR